MARKSGSDPTITGPRIAAAAEKLIARHGYAAVTMRQIAAEAGVQAGSIYLYFADKQGLLFELMDAHMDALLAAWAEVPKTARPMARLRTFTDFHIAYHLDRPDAVFIAYMELRNLSPENFSVIEAKRRTYEGELEAILKEGAKAGAFAISDLRITVMAIIAMLTGISTWYRNDGRLPRARVMRIYWRLARRMVRATVESEEGPEAADG